MAQENNSGDVCSHERAYVCDNWLRRIAQNPKRIVGEYVQNGDTVMDIGCGPGYFAVAMAKMVGENGKVIAVDLQPEMLEKARMKAKREQVENIEFQQCEADSLGLKDQANFILAYYMVHETPSTESCLTEIKQALKPNGKLLVVEPRFHVSRKQFKEMIKIAESCGLVQTDTPSWKGGLSALFTLASGE